jgi:hypothetical protein
MSSAVHFLHNSRLQGAGGQSPTASAAAVVPRKFCEKFKGIMRTVLVCAVTLSCAAHPLPGVRC